MGPMGELGALFNPGMRHELEERRAKAARREEEGNARDGDLRIDLESGVAVINIPDADDDADADAESGSTEVADDVAGGEGSTDADGAQSQADTAPDPAPQAPLRPRGKRGMTASSR